MIIGGNGYIDGTTLDSVELFNWQTGEQCQIGDFYKSVGAHSGTVLEGVPIICGGYESGHGLDECYKLNKDEMVWEQVCFILFLIIKIF